MDRKKILELIKKKEARKAELNQKAQTTDDIAELRSINAEMDALNNDISELRATITVIETDDDDDGDENTCPNCKAAIDEGDKFCAACGSPVNGKRSKAPKGGEKRSTQLQQLENSPKLNVLATYGWRP